MTFTVDHPVKFEIYCDQNGEWCRRFKAGNGTIMATASEGHVSKGECQHSIGLVQTSSDLPVVAVEK